MTTYITHTYIWIRYIGPFSLYVTRMSAQNINQCEHVSQVKNHIYRIYDSTVLRSHSFAHRSKPLCAVINPISCPIINALRYDKCMLRNDYSWNCRSLLVYKNFTIPNDRPNKRPKIPKRVLSEAAIDSFIGNVNIMNISAFSSAS